jgi:hypothetical protein
LSVPITIRIDDYLPYWGGWSTPLFSKVMNNGVWMNILEKAFAKMYGNYSAVVAGSPERAVQNLLGTPGFLYVNSKLTTSQLWKAIDDAKFQDVMVALTGSTSYYGLQTNHAFTLVDNFAV